ncbi:hypothetical protein V7161_24055 [Neobacillus drentensis]|uniref:hypothetical protein n=1 Tax=Neobacillus drentensis TaxID=220684 RepID=UPI003002FAAD
MSMWFDLHLGYERQFALFNCGDGHLNSVLLTVVGLLLSDLTFILAMKTVLVG